MVAYTYHCDHHFTGLTRFCRQYLYCCAICLYFVLMKHHEPYQQVLAMVIGFSVLSVLTGHSVIAWVAWAMGFLCLAWKDFAVAFTTMMSKIAATVFGGLLKVVLVLFYFLLLTPLALLSGKRSLPGGWKDSKVHTPEQMRRMG